MPLKIIRVAGGKNSTLSHLYLDGLFLCFLPEDKIRAKKMARATCTTEGNYQLRLNTYPRLLAALHQGNSFLEIRNQIH